MIRRIVDGCRRAVGGRRRMRYTSSTEIMWKRLLWPEIVNDADVDTVTRQGFWLCVALSVLSLMSGPVGGDKFAVLSSAAFMFAAAIGVRNHSIPAAVAVLAVYLGERLLLLRLASSPRCSSQTFEPHGLPRKLRQNELSLRLCRWPRRSRKSSRTFSPFASGLTLNGCSGYSLR